MKMITVENEKKMDSTKNQEFDIVLKMKCSSTYFPATTALCIYFIDYYKF